MSTVCPHVYFDLKTSSCVTSVHKVINIIIMYTSTCTLIVRLITVFQAEIIAFNVQIHKGKDEFVLDQLPDDPVHVVCKTQKHCQYLDTAPFTSPLQAKKASY